MDQLNKLLETKNMNYYYIIYGSEVMKDNFLLEEKKILHEITERFEDYKSISKIDPVVYFT